jgi:hypothetical protein
VKAVAPLVLAVGAVVAAAGFDLLRNGHVHVEDGHAIRHIHPALAAHSHSHDHDRQPAPPPAEPADPSSDPAPPRTIWAAIALTLAPSVPAPVALGLVGRAPLSAHSQPAPSPFRALPLSRGPPA